MNLTKFFIPVSIVLITLSSCSNDDDAGTVSDVIAPETYSFERNNESTVSFGGQTTRIAMASAVVAALKNTEKTEDALSKMFDHQEGNPDFDSETLNASTKSVRSKVAASKDFFATNTAEAKALKEDFDTWIINQVNEVFPNWNNQASKGEAGFIEEGGADPATRYVTAKGVELNQLFAKGLIGALMTDQMLNNYLSTAVLDEAGNVEANDDEEVAEGKNYTTMEHKWDEAYGYAYGASENSANPNATIGEDDDFLNKYIGRVENDTDYTGIAKEIFDAFKLGRAAIVAKKYEVRNEQANIIREKISQIIAIRAIYYLQQGKSKIDVSSAIDYADVFHDLSEGLGFVYSLQFTRKPNEKEPYFSKQEVTAFIEQLTGSENGLWDVTPETLQSISETIAQRFELDVTEAGS